MLGEYTMVVGHLENGEVDGDNIKMDCWEVGCEFFLPLAVNVRPVSTR
jgi:hypothetical protein